MKLPQLKEPQKYTGLYVLDFGDQTAVGYTAQEVAELLESEKFKDTKVYKIHRAHPDGKLELKGINSGIFQLEAGLFFYSNKIETSKDDFQRLIALAVKNAPPCRAKAHLAKYDEQTFAVALIYPAEYDDQISRWLIEGQYKTSGPAQGGTAAVEQYYNQKPEILQRHQFFGESVIQSRTGRQLLASVKIAVQR